MKTRFSEITFSLVTALMLTLTGLASDDLDIRGQWHFDDGTEMIVTDSSENTNDGALRKASWKAGVRNSALQIERGGFVDFGNDASLDIQDEITLEAWVKPWAPRFPEKPTILAKQGAYALHFGPKKAVSFTLWFDGKQKTVSSNESSWPNGQWQHIGGTFDGQTMKLFVNGELDNELKLDSPKQISISKSPLYAGSVKQRHPLSGTIDEAQVTATAVPAEIIYNSYHDGKYEIEREASNFAGYFSKTKKRQAKAVVPGTLWIDAEDFDDYGGWWMDTQFVPQMGSPYLLAAGIGNPVEDASTTINVPEPGTYQLWVRTRNWLDEHAPGKFQIVLGDHSLEKVFGAGPSGQWVWEDGGTHTLAAGELHLALKDLTGFYGRCDAIVLTQDMDYQPSSDVTAYKIERARYTGASTAAKDMGNFDVVVVGAGVAGINAAIASARTGAKTALIQDRPMIGGNNSLELGVIVSGPANHGHPVSRESGLNEEIGRERAYNFHGKWSQGAEIIAAKEPNLTIFLNTHVNEVERDGHRIKAVRAFNMIDGSRTRYTADQFIDCTGDGWLGYYAGAQYRIGREASSEFGETHAPEFADNITMSGCIMTGHTLSYNTKKMKEAQPYTGPEWLWDLRPNGKNIEARNDFEGSHTYGRWWHENDNRVDDLWDPENARDQLLRLNLSYWNWVKNYSSLKDKATHYKMTILPIGNAKRETRRLVGDHILTEHDVLKPEPFPDAIATGGWSLDIHHPKGIFSEDGPFDFNTMAPLNRLPFRILYSKNIENLLFAGRNVSCTHTALGNVRVQGTTGVLGQAAGTAAAICAEKGIDPRELYQNHIKELQQQLLKDDQYIIGFKNEDEADLARSTNITASSEKSPAYTAANVTSGVSRIVGEEMHMWASDPEQPMPQWLQIEMDEPQAANAIYLTFDTDLNDQRHSSWEFLPEDRMPPEVVRDYELQIFDGSDWKTIDRVKNNYQRRRIHRFDQMDISKVKLLATATNGDKSARIYEVRIYNE
ncbi:MAG: FAD-dependent oxidoreductase [Verrucomicrobiota bacterium]